MERCIFWQFLSKRKQRFNKILIFPGISKKKSFQIGSIEDLLKIVMKYLHLFIFSGLLVSSCSTYMKIPVVKYMPQKYMKVMKGGRNIAIIMEDKKTRHVSGYGDWKGTLRGSIENSLQSQGFFRIIDISSREKRLKELAAMQTGITDVVKEMGREFAIDGLLYIEMPAAPASSCTRKRSEHSHSKCVRRNLEGKCIKYKKYIDIKYTGVLTTQVAVKGKLINVQTGESIVYTYSQPTRSQSSLGDPSCPSRLDGFSRAANQAGYAIARHLSPQMGNLEADLESDPVGVPDELEDEVETHLKNGIKWAEKEPPDFDEAYKSWRKAKQIAGNTSPSANWNLAIYQWFKGNMVEAEEEFRSAKTNGGPDWLDDDKMTILAKFKEEKKRLEMAKEGNEF